MIWILIILLLLIIISFSIYYFPKEKTHESYVNYMMADPNMIKDIQDTPDSDRLLILSEIFNNVNNHEIKLNAYDTEYTISVIRPNPSIGIMNNVNNIIPYLEKQDRVLTKLTRGTYIPSSNLEKLKDGTLLEPLKTDLTKLKDFDGPPLMPQVETDPIAMIRKAELYELYANGTKDKIQRTAYYIERDKNLALAEKTTDPVLKQSYLHEADKYATMAGGTKNKKVKKELINKANELRVASKKKIIENEPPKNMPNDTSPRITEDQINSRLETAALYYIMKIIEYQDSIINNMTNEIINYFKKTYNGMIDV